MSGEFEGRQPLDPSLNITLVLRKELAHSIAFLEFTLTCITVRTTPHTPLTQNTIDIEFICSMNGPHCHYSHHNHCMCHSHLHCYETSIKQLYTVLSEALLQRDNENHTMSTSYESHMGENCTACREALCNNIGIWPGESGSITCRIVGATRSGSQGAKSERGAKAPNERAPGKDPSQEVGRV